MKKQIIKEIKIPEGVKVELEENIVRVIGEHGEVRKKFSFANLNFKIKDDKITLENKKATKKEKKRINTNAAHLKNMIKGVQEPFQYKLKICFNHFPISIEIKDGEAIIKNFLGEKSPRKVKIPSGADIKIDKDIITVSSPDKEIAGQAAAVLERVTKIRLRDRRVFQDGIFLINKAGKEI
jgi:large subunit ribosomal protein L6